jgi:hypothetical protein
VCSVRGTGCSAFTAFETGPAKARADRVSRRERVVYVRAGALDLRGLVVGLGRQHRVTMAEYGGARDMVVANFLRGTAPRAPVTWYLDTERHTPARASSDS